MKEWKLIDAKNLILGRLASHVAKLALMGNNIIIINSKDVQISGNKRNIVEHYYHYKNIKTRSNPRRGPFRVGTRPDIFIRKTIKPMLPKNMRGSIAFKRIHAYISDIPEYKRDKYEKITKIELPNDINAEKLMGKRISVGEVCEIIGWNKGGLR
ncbi:MAG: 50S ribosomal protein L13 [Promethearchaeota archaeon]